MQEIPIMFCFDKNYVIPAAACFYSLLENNPPPPGVITPSSFL